MKNARGNSANAARKGDATPVDCDNTKNARSGSTCAASKGDATPVDCNDNLLATRTCKDAGAFLAGVDNSAASKTAQKVDGTYSSDTKIGFNIEAVSGATQISSSETGGVKSLTGGESSSCNCISDLSAANTRTEQRDVDYSVSAVSSKLADDSGGETRTICVQSDCARTDSIDKREPASSVTSEIRSPSSADRRSHGTNSDECQSLNSSLLASQQRMASSKSSADDCKGKIMAPSNQSLSRHATPVDGADNSKTVADVAVVVSSTRRSNEEVPADVDPASPAARREPVEDLRIRSSTPVDRSSKTSVSDVDSALLVLMSNTSAGLPHRTSSSPFTGRKYEMRSAPAQASHVAGQLRSGGTGSSLSLGSTPPPGSPDRCLVSSPGLSNSDSSISESPVAQKSSDGAAVVQTQCINAQSEEESVAGDKSDDVNERSSSSSCENIFGNIKEDVRELSVAGEDDKRVSQHDISVDNVDDSDSGDDSDEEVTSPWTETQQFRHNDSFAKKDLKQWHFHSVASPPPKRFAFRKPEEGAVSSADTNFRDGDIASNGVSRGARRVAFDPLTLCLNAALEGEFDTLKEAFSKVSSRVRTFSVM
jgi:hypothetical protein